MTIGQSTEKKSNITAYLKNSNIEWLDEQDESRGQLLRQAVDDLREKREGPAERPR